MNSSHTTNNLIGSGSNEVADTVYWAKYSKPIQDHERTPDMHFQATNYWVHLKWISDKVAIEEWTPSGGLTEQSFLQWNASEVTKFLEEKSRELIESNFILNQEGSYPLGAIDFEAIKVKIKKDAKSSFIELREKLTERSMCGFALYSDGCAMTLSASATTLEDIENRDSMLSKDEALFGVCEWNWENDFRKETFGFLNAINVQTEWQVPFEPKINFNEYTQSFFEACVSALEELRNEGFFPNQDEQDFVLLVDVSDDDPIKNMFLRLNPKRLYRRYKKATREPSFIEAIWLDWKIKREIS